LGLIAMVAAALLAWPAQAAETLQIPSAAIPTAPGARPAPGPLEATLTLPAGARGPVPVIILLHGCAGWNRGMDRWVERVNGWGYAALVLLSFPARQVRTVCAPADQAQVTGADRAGDVLNAALALRNHAGIDGLRIGVIGLSHGGGTAMALTQSQFESFRPGLIKAAVNYYGPCRLLQLHGKIPVLALNGTDDTWGNPATTCRQFAEYLQPDQHFELHSYAGVVHAFDNPGLVTRRYNEGHPMQYDAAAADDSFARAKAFLDRWVRDAH
jgi:dienelactone hydrolase